MDVNAVRRKLQGEIDGLEQEAKVVYAQLVLPHWGDEQLHGFPRTLYGYMMLSFAYVDLLSTYWRGSSQGQTKRMIDFMELYDIAKREACSAAVQIWRHKLLHTGSPRPLFDESTGKVYRWLLPEISGCAQCPT